ncbi:MAG: PAS domain S-box protein, partial [Nitrospirota bacterium]
MKKIIISSSHPAGVRIFPYSLSGVNLVYYIEYIQNRRTKLIPSKPRTSALKLLIITTVALFLSEAAIMLFLRMLPPLPIFLEVILDALVLVGLGFLILYYSLFRPMNLYILERNRSEEMVRRAYAELNQIFQTAADGMLVIDADFAILRVNETFARLAGTGSAGAIGKKCYEVFPGEQCHTSACPVTRIMSGEERVEFETLKKGTDGRGIDCMVTATPFRGDNRQLIGIVEDFKDITMRKKAENALIKMEEERMKIQKLESLGLLAGGIAHDFNNLLTAIIGNVAMTKMDLDSRDESFKSLDMAEKAALRAKDLTRQLITFSRGGDPVRKSVVLPDLLRDSAKFVTSGSNVRCVFLLPDDLEPVDVDEGQMNQVLNNVLINAVQAMPEGGIVTIHGENIAITEGSELPLQKGRYVKMSIRDGGCGIPKEDLGRIFDPYFTT